MFIQEKKTALVTGASSGMGKAIARRLIQEGYQVYVAARQLGKMDDLASLGAQCLQMDLSRQDDRLAVVNTILSQTGGVDVLVNNVGITQPLKLMDIKRANYDAVLDVSLRGTLLMSQAVIPTMRAQKSGSIVCISSVSAQRGGGIFGGPHYSAAKAGVLGLARAMARELGPDNVRVNCITPGLIQTDITAGKLTDDMTANILAGIPMNRLGDAVDIARAALFLGSDLSSYSTGITLDVNGGMLIH